MVGADDCRSGSGSGSQKRPAETASPRNERQRSKRLRRESAQVLNLDSDRSERLQYRQAAKCLQSPVPHPHLSQSASRPSTSATPGPLIIIDLTGDDDEDIAMESAHEEAIPNSTANERDSHRQGQSDKGKAPLATSSRPAVTHDPPQTVAPDNDPRYDTCFGLLEISCVVKSSVMKDMDVLPVKLKLSTEAVKLVTVSPPENIGRASSACSPTLHRLQRSAKVFWTALVVVSETRRQCQYVQATLRVVVYGLMCEKKTVAKILGDGELFLQHPSLSECDSRVPYFNPQYLLRPGGSMPPLENLSISPRSAGGEATTEVEMTRLLKIFESAHDPDATFGIRPSKRLQSTLKDHQISALAMMIEKECGTYDKSAFPALWVPRIDYHGLRRYYHIVTGEPRENHPPPVRGGILADEMGLGKTLSAISLILWHIDSLESSKSWAGSGSRVTLIVTPKSTIPEWNQQFEKHVKPGEISVRTYHGSNRQQVAVNWHDADVILTTYDTLRSEKLIGGPLYQMKWARVILDEAHHVRNRDSKGFSAVQALHSPRRWCLTGTPIQNCLDDFGALLSFIGVHSLEKATDFKHWIADPIKKKKGYAFEHFRRLVKATCLRRTKDSIKSTLKLPKKQEVNTVLELGEGERELYDFFKRRAATIAITIEKAKGSNVKPPKLKRGGSGGSGSNILPLIGHLRRICDHGESLLPVAALRAWQDRDIESLDWQMMAMGSQKCDSCAAELEDDDIDVLGSVEFGCGHTICAKCLGADDGDGSQPAQPSCLKCAKSSPLPPTALNGNCSGGEHQPSTKINALLQNLRKELAGGLTDGEGKGEVSRSCWAKMLDFIQKALEQNDIGFRRIDGQTSLVGRADAMRAFRNDPKCRVMLATIGSVVEGVNFTVANHVHIMEPHWNPMVEAQAVDRVHRIGQTRDVMITRYLIKDSIEFYVRDVQQEKIRLIHQSLSSSELKQSEIDGQRFKARNNQSYPHTAAGNTLTLHFPETLGITKMSYYT